MGSKHSKSICLLSKSLRSAQFSWSVAFIWKVVGCRDLRSGLWTQTNLGLKPSSARKCVLSISYLAPFVNRDNDASLLWGKECKVPSTCRHPFHATPFPFSENIYLPSRSALHAFLRMTLPWCLGLRRGASIGHFASHPNQPSCFLFLKTLSSLPPVMSSLGALYTVKVSWPSRLPEAGGVVRR